MSFYSNIPPESLEAQKTPSWHGAPLTTDAYEDPTLGFVMKAPFVHASSPPNLGGGWRILFGLLTTVSSAGSATWPGTGDATGWDVCGSLAFGSGDKTSNLAGGLTIMVPWGTIKSSDNIGVSREGEESVPSGSRCGGMERIYPSA